MLRSATLSSVIAVAIWSLPLFGQSIEQGTLFLVGDAGATNLNRDYVLRHIGVSIENLVASDADRPIAVVFLGDNVYSEGIRPDHVAEDGAILVDQVTLGAADVRAPVYFVPGNHDWANGDHESEALRRLEMQSALIQAIASEWDRDAYLYPSPGCPGPRQLALGDVAHLFLIDTEWLLRGARTCPGVSREEFLHRLAIGLGNAKGRHAFVLAHHPLATGGPHGGRGGGFNSVMAKLRLSQEDVFARRYANAINDLKTAIRESGHDRVTYAAGHEHSLQVIDPEPGSGAPLVLVSGSGAKTSPVDSIGGSRYWASAYGYMRVDFFGDDATLTVVCLKDYLTPPEETSMPLFHSAVEPRGACR